MNIKIDKVKNMPLTKHREKSQRKNAFFIEMSKNRVLYLMTLPAILLVFVFSYLPMVGIVMAFKNTQGSKNFFDGEWIGFKNFEFFFTSQDALRISFNTIFMNSIFIISGLIISVVFAILLNELGSKKLVKIYQTTMFLPYFLSWVIIGFLAYSFLSVDNGLINRILIVLHLQPVQWYSEPKYWPSILAIINLIKTAGYFSIIYFAGIIGINDELYEATMIDGANRFQQIFYVTIPLITPLICIMTLLQVGKIFYADFGLFYYIPRETGVLFSTTDVIDTYVFRSLKVLGNTGMSTAIGFYQSVVGFVLVFVSNFIVKKVNKENALF